MKFFVAALACLLAAAPLAGQEDAPSGTMACGFRFSAAIPHSKVDRDASFGAAFGGAFVTEWMVGRRVALCPSAEYLFLPTKEEQRYVTNPQGQQVPVPVRSEGNIIKVGADLAFRPDGILGGPFYFAGAGIDIMKVSETYGPPAAPAKSKDEFGVVYVTFGAGYDFSSYFGVEVRYSNMLPSYEEKYKYASGAAYEQQYSKIGDLNNIQLSARIRF
jgi:hypothetical protein